MGIQKVVSPSDQAPPLSLVASLPLPDKLDQDQLSDDHRPRSSSAGASCARILLPPTHTWIRLDQIVCFVLIMLMFWPKRQINWPFWSKTQKKKKKKKKK